MVHRGKESTSNLGASLNSVSASSVLIALLSPTAPTALAVRSASKKTGGSSKNLGGKSRGKHYGIKKMEGEGVPSFLFSYSAALLLEEPKCYSGASLTRISALHCSTCPHIKG